MAHWQQWRKTRPAADPSPALHLAAPVEFKLENGLKVLLVEQQDLPLLTAHVVSRAGSDNGPRKSGLAKLTSQLMGDRSVSRDQAALAGDQERLERASAHLQAWTRERSP